MPNKLANLVIALLLFAVLFLAIDNSYTELAKSDVTPISVVDIAGGSDSMYGIFNDFIFPFELLSLLLLAALIGALYVAKKEA